MRGAWLIIAATGLCACGAGPAGPARGAVEAAADVRATPVSAEQFPGAVARLVLERERSTDRLGLLHGTVARHLDRARGYFARGHAETGYEATVGALFLVREGEFSPRMLEGSAEPLLAAATLAAQKGLEGEALALYSGLRAALPPGKERQDVEEHLAAMASWASATRSSGTLQALGETQRTLVARSLLEPTEDTVRRAGRAAVRWIAEAIEYSQDQLPPRTNFERDEAIEAYGAVRTGALTVVALHLRHGDAASAVAALSNDTVARVAAPALQEALGAAADDDPDAWYELFKTYDSYIDEASAESPVSRELARAASWGAALELYRVEPGTLRGIMPVCTWLSRHWMSEAGLEILVPSMGGMEDPRALSWATNYLLQAIVNEEAVDNVAAARRVFAAAGPILEAATRSKHAARISPSPTRLRYVMGAIEARVGSLSRAHDLLLATTRSEPSIPALRLLSAIDRQRGERVEALEGLEGILQIATQAGDVTTVAETHAAAFEIHRDLGDGTSAQKALDLALRRALDARQLARTGSEQAAAERALARILEHYGETAAARRATERAYEASHQDVRELTATLLDASRRALTQEDLGAARDAARRAIEAHLPDDDLVYVALWLRLLERRLDAPSDGTVEEAFAATEAQEGWAATLRAWGSGKLDDDALSRAATSIVERTEAMFYGAMASRGHGSDRETFERLESVASSEAIQLVEVTIARDLIASKKQELGIRLPADVEIP